MASEQLVVFQLGAEEYAFSISQVKEIIIYDGATKLPNTPEYMEGIIDLRGKVIPVVDMAKRFCLAVEKGANKQAVIVEAAGNEVGVVVDEVSEVLMLDDSVIEPVNTMTTYVTDFLRGIGRLEDRLILILDLDKIFSGEKMELIQEIV